MGCPGAHRLAYISQSGTARSYTPARIKAWMQVGRQADRHRPARRADRGAEPAEEELRPQRRDRGQALSNDREADTPPLGPPLNGLPPQEAEDAAIAETAPTTAAQAPATSRSVLDLHPERDPAALSLLLPGVRVHVPAGVLDFRAVERALGCEHDGSTRGPVRRGR